jgi:hypothetical protein
MTAPEMFTIASKQPLTTGRRPDMTAIGAFQTFSATSRIDVKWEGLAEDEGRPAQLASTKGERDRANHPSDRARAVAFGTLSAGI